MHFSLKAPSHTLFFTIAYANARKALLTPLLQHLGVLKKVTGSPSLYTWDFGPNALIRRNMLCVCFGLHVSELSILLFAKPIDKFLIRSQVVSSAVPTVIQFPNAKSHAVCPLPCKKSWCNKSHSKPVTASQPSVPWRSAPGFSWDWDRHVRSTNTFVVLDLLAFQSIA